MRAIYERTTAGLSVSVGWDTLTRNMLLVCQRNGRIEVAEVPSTKAKDAFVHPACYLAPDQLTLITAR